MPRRKTIVKPVCIELFSDTGGILILDPAHASKLAREEALMDFNVVLDPEGATDQTAGFTPEQWRRIWRASTGRLRAFSAEGEFALVLSGEGTFYVRVQAKPLSAVEGGRVMNTFVERVRVTSGALAITDGMEFFEGEATLSPDRAFFVPVANGEYELQGFHLATPAGVTPTIGIHGTPDHPALVLILGAGKDVDANTPESFTQLNARTGGHLIAQAGWNCRGRVTRVAEDKALMQLLMTDSVSSGFGGVGIPEGIPVRAGDFVLVNLVEYRGGRWECKWLRAFGH